MKEKQLPRLHLACSYDELRPVMNNVFVTKKHTIASNGHVLIQFDTNYLFNDQFVNDMPEQFMIHRNIWQKLCKKNYAIYFKDDLINVQYKGYSDIIRPIINTDLPYPNYLSCFPEKKDKEKVTEIGLSSITLNILTKSLFTANDNPVMKFELYSKYKAIVVHLEESIKAKALIMPCNIDNF